MPYATVKELPVNIRDKYSDKAQEVFMAAWNQVYKDTNDEARAFAAAHSAADKIDKTPPVKEAVTVEPTDATFREASFNFEGVFSEAPTRDEESGVYKIPVTLIQPGLSKNKVYYSKKWLSDFAEAMEGKKAFLNHEKASEIKDRKSRSVNDVAGWYTQVKQDEDGAVKGILNLVETPQTEHVVKIAKANPELVGLSINAKGKASRGKVDSTDAMIAETVERVYSTDIVTEAAAGGEMGAMRLVASVTMDIDDDDKPPTDKTIDNKEVETMTDEEKASATWLIAEMKHTADSFKTLADTSGWLLAEKNFADGAKIIESLMEKVPEKMKPAAEGMDKDRLEKFIEAITAEPPEVKGNPPAGTPVPEKQPGEEGYERKLL